MTSAVNNNSVSQSVLDTLNAQNGSKASAAEDQKNQFLTLLVTQLQNQDPLNPLDNAEVTSQLAQLSTVTGIDQLNATLQSLSGSYQSSQSIQAAGLINHGILAPGSAINLTSATANDGTVTTQGILGVNFSQNVDSAQVTIKDATGATVATLDIGKQNAGTVPLSWDGKKTDGTVAPAGNYTFTVDAAVAGVPVDTTALQFGVVNTVSTAAGQEPQLNVSGGLDSVKFSNVYQIL